MDDATTTGGNDDADAAHAPADAETALTTVDDLEALEGELVPREPEGFLPALRADLAPLVPPLRRAATVVAVAALTDWALRAGSRRLLVTGASRLAAGQVPSGRLLSEPRRASSETIIVERLIIHRSG